jgi:hypothetical protein
MLPQSSEEMPCCLVLDGRSVGKVGWPTTGLGNLFVNLSVQWARWSPGSLSVLRMYGSFVFSNGPGENHAGTIV